MGHKGGAEPFPEVDALGRDIIEASPSSSSDLGDGDVVVDEIVLDDKATTTKNSIGFYSPLVSVEIVTQHRIDGRSFREARHTAKDANGEYHTSEDNYQDTEIHEDLNKNPKTETAGGYGSILSYAGSAAAAVGKAYIDSKISDGALAALGLIGAAAQIEAPPATPEAEEGWIDWLLGFVPFVGSGKKAIENAPNGPELYERGRDQKAQAYNDILNGNGNAQSTQEAGKRLSRQEAEGLKGMAEYAIDFNTTAPGLAQAGAFGAPVKASTGSQVHHIATHYGKWGDKFKSLFDKAGIKLNDAINKMDLPGHKGRHIEEYHRYVYNALSKAIGNKTGDAARRALEGALNGLRKELEANPRLPYADGGLR